MSISFSVKAKTALTPSVSKAEGETILSENSFGKDMTEILSRQKSSALTTADKANRKREEKAAEEEKLEKRRKFEDLLTDLAHARRQVAEYTRQSLRDVAEGDADYVPGPKGVVRPSVLESFV